MMPENDNTNKMMIRSAKKLQLLRKKQEREKERERKRIARNTRQSAWFTIRSLPNQIALARLHNPDVKWIYIRPSFFWGVFASSSRDINARYLVELLRENGYDANYVDYEITLNINHPHHPHR